METKLFALVIWFAFANGNVGMTTFVVRNECNREVAIQYAFEKLPLSIPEGYAMQDPRKWLRHECLSFPPSPGPGDAFDFSPTPPPTPARKAD